MLSDFGILPAIVRSSWVLKILLCQINFTVSGTISTIEHTISLFSTFIQNFVELSTT